LHYLRAANQPLKLWLTKSIPIGVPHAVLASTNVRSKLSRQVTLTLSTLLLASIAALVQVFAPQRLSVPNKIIDKALRRETLTENEALALFEQVPLSRLAAVADEVRKAVMTETMREAAVAGTMTVADPEAVTWQIDRNVNITNVCVSGCKFCNFHCKPHQADRAYILSLDDYIPRIEETLALGGDQLLLQGDCIHVWA
jgi:hypothetical protein